MADDAPPADALAIDPLVARTATNMADIINGFKRDLDERDGIWAHAHGTIELGLRTDDSRTFELSIVPDSDGEEYPIMVRTQQKKGGAAATGAPDQLQRRASDSDFDTDSVLGRKRGREDDDQDASSKRPRLEATTAVVSKTDLESLLSKLRHESPAGSPACVEHVQGLLRRFEPPGPLAASAATNGAPPAALLPTPAVERRASAGGPGEGDSTLSGFLRRENKVLSSQIRWVEDCRRLADEQHDRREDNWRTTSATFHDRARQNREQFQDRMLHESAMQAQALHQILNEVRTIGLYAQSMKWELPGSLNAAAPLRSNAPPPMSPAAASTGPARQPAAAATTAAATPPRADAGGTKEPAAAQRTWRWK